MKVSGGYAHVVRNSVSNNCTGADMDKGVSVQANTGTVINKVITQNGSLGLSCQGDLVIADHNDVWGQTADYEEGTRPGYHDIHADPLYVNPVEGPDLSDHHLRADSPCIDEGDIDGDFRPQGDYSDIGADEVPSIPGWDVPRPAHASPVHVNDTETSNALNVLFMLLLPTVLILLGRRCFSLRWQAGSKESSRYRGPHS